MAAKLTSLKRCVTTGLKTTISHSCSPNSLNARQAKGKLNMIFTLRLSHFLKQAPTAVQHTRQSHYISVSEKYMY